ADHPDLVQIMPPAIDPAARDARHQAAFLQGWKCFVNFNLAEIEERIAIGLLIRTGDDGVKTERISVRRRLRFFDEDTENAALSKGKRSDCFNGHDDLHGERTAPRSKISGNDLIRKRKTPSGGQTDFSAFSASSAFLTSLWPD